MVEIAPLVMDPLVDIEPIAREATPSVNVADVTDETDDIVDAEVMLPALDVEPLVIDPDVERLPEDATRTPSVRVALATVPTADMLTFEYTDEELKI